MITMVVVSNEFLRKHTRRKHDRRSSQQYCYCIFFLHVVSPSKAHKYCYGETYPRFALRLRMCQRWVASTKAPSRTRPPENRHPQTRSVSRKATSPRRPRNRAFVGSTGVPRLCARRRSFSPLQGSALNTLGRVGSFLAFVRVQSLSLRCR